MGRQRERRPGASRAWDIVASEGDGSRSADSGVKGNIRSGRGNFSIRVHGRVHRRQRQQQWSRGHQRGPQTRLRGIGGPEVSARAEAAEATLAGGSGGGVDGHGGGKKGGRCRFGSSSESSKRGQGGSRCSHSENAKTGEATVRNGKNAN